MASVEPRFRRPGVNMLFGAVLLVVVVGSLTDEGLGNQNHMTDGDVRAQAAACQTFANESSHRSWLHGPPQQ